MQLVDKPGPELDGIPLLLDGEALVAGRHDRLHELVRADLHPGAMTCHSRPAQAACEP